MLLNANRTDTRAASTVGNTECLVQVQMADIGSQSTRGSKANLCVHVGAVHVDLAAVVVDLLADVDDIRFEHTESAWVGNHNGCQLIFVLLALGLEIGHVKVSGLGVALDDDDTHTGHCGGSRVRTVGG